MTAFYSDLKKLREEQNIDLSEISNRTKINKRFLECIEKGDFDFLPKVYVRLFIKAYTSELGTDPEEFLNKLEKHLSGEKDESYKDKKVGDNLSPIDKDKDGETTDKSPFQIRSDVIKAVIMVALLIFAIFTVKKIVSKPGESNKVISVKNGSDLVEFDNDFSESDYEKEVTENIIPLNPPYQITLNSEDSILYQIKSDDENFNSDYLGKGGEIIKEFKSSVFLRVNHTTNMNAFINDTKVELNPSNFPADIAYDVKTGKLSISSYLPK